MREMPPRQIFRRLQDLPLFKAFLWLPARLRASRQAVLSALSFLPQIYSQVTNYDNVPQRFNQSVPVQIGTILIPLPKPYNYFSNTVRIDHQAVESETTCYIATRSISEINPTQRVIISSAHRWAAAQEILRQNHAISYTRIISSAVFERSANRLRQK